MIRATFYNTFPFYTWKEQFYWSI